MIDIEPLGPTHGKFALAEITVAKNSDFGRNDRQFITRTHLGNLLNPGDMVAGYDVSTANLNEQDLEGLRGGAKNLPDIVLVHKSYPERRNKPRNRHWKLKALAKERENNMNRKSVVEAADRDYADFLHQLELDPEMRSQINLFKAGDAPQKRPVADGDMDVDDQEADFPEVTMDELLDDMDNLTIADESEAQQAYQMQQQQAAMEQQQLLMQQQQQQMMMQQQQQNGFPSQQGFGFM